MLMESPPAHPAFTRARFMGLQDTGKPLAAVGVSNILKQKT